MSDVFVIVFPLWLHAFLLTLVIEVPVFVLVWRFGRSLRRPLWRIAAAGAAGTVLTHPLLWFVWPRVVTDYNMYVLTGEVIVAVVESFTFFALARPITLRRAIAASLLANGASYGIGVLVQ